MHENNIWGASRLPPHICTIVKDFTTVTIKHQQVCVRERDLEAPAWPEGGAERRTCANQSRCAQLGLAAVGMTVDIGSGPYCREIYGNGGRGRWRGHRCLEGGMESLVQWSL